MRFVAGGPHGVQCDMMLVALAVMLSGAPPSLVLRGTVRDQSGLPVPRALVYIDGTQTSRVLLDDAVVFHPYRSATPAAGYSAASSPFFSMASRLQPADSPRTKTTR